MKMSRIYIHPSGFGGGLTIAEALACGLLVIAYDTPLVRYAYGKCPAVFLTPHGDVEAFARKFTKLINDTSLLRRYSVIATQYAKRHCNWEDVVESEKRAYLKVLEECHLR
jgi:glycosyltransferase involved in cell wall biosynthesis